MGRQSFDFLVIGGGIAGLSHALEVAQHGSVAVLFKKARTESSTAWAQGGIAAVSDPDDSFEKHIEDTLTAGAGLCREEIVELVVKEGPVLVEELIRRGVEFDWFDEGHWFHLHKEGGHSKRRIFHAADATGFEIQRALLEAAKASPNIAFFDECCAIDIITSRKHLGDSHSENRALGAYVLLPDGKIEAFLAKNTLVATGGAGKIYLYTSNPDVATGDGIAMCFRAGVPVLNLEFFQFHPTCLYHPEAKSFLITEAMRGEGAKLLRVNGEAFMQQYDEREELASRDIVARAIDSEMKKHGEDHVLLDIRHKGKDFILEHFPNIYERCKSFGFDISAEPIPVVPAAHYCCGGVESDAFGQTNIDGLFVAGEVAHTGLHGANRLASNSLLEGLVFAYRSAAKAIERLSSVAALPEVPEWDSGDAVDSDEEVIISQNWDEIRRFMWNFVGIVRSDKRLARALHRSELIEREIQEYYWNFYLHSDLLELRNLSLVARLTILSALQRKESRGLHFTIDYPSRLKDAHDTKILPDDL